jgi:hypothetical protein
VVAIESLEEVGAVFTNHAGRYNRFLRALVGCPTVAPAPWLYLCPYRLLKEIGMSTPEAKPTLRSILLEQLHYTHTKKDWYVPLAVDLEGLTVEQANWSDSTDNHSIGQIVSHLTFWNERTLIAFQGHKPPDYDDNNDKTFTRFERNQGQETVHRLDRIQTLWERSVEGATEAQLDKWSSSIANICSHNAYHTGQIVYIRMKNGWWVASKGVR